MVARILAAGIVCATATGSADAAAAAASRGDGETTTAAADHASAPRALYDTIRNDPSTSMFGGRPIAESATAEQAALLRALGRTGYRPSSLRPALEGACTASARRSKRGPTRR